VSIFSSIQEELIKKEFAHLSSIYFNTAYFGPTPYRAKQKVSNALFKELDPSFFPYPTWVGIPERIRSQMAALLGCKITDLTLGTSTNDFVSLIARGLRLPNLQGQKLHVCSFQGEYPSNVLPWLRAQELNDKLHFSLIPSPEKTNEFFTTEWLEKNLPKETKVVNFSYVQFDSGRKIPLFDILTWLKKKNIFVIVDGTQAFGGQAIDSAELALMDVFIFSTYKWFLGPYGQAFAYFSSYAQEVINHDSGNWIVSPNSKEVHQLTNYTTETLPGARKYDRGQSPNMLTNSCLEAAMELFAQIPMTTVEKHNHQLRDYFLLNFPHTKFNLVTPSEKEFQSCIIAITSQTVDPLKLEVELKHRNIDVSVRQGKLRISFHLFNTQKHVDELIKALEET
jgi:selenocysteine lyase/cysteine desulfurase